MIKKNQQFKLQEHTGESIYITEENMNTTNFCQIIYFLLCYGRNDVFFFPFKCLILLFVSGNRIWMLDLGSIIFSNEFLKICVSSIHTTKTF